jgi:hypothetical protein
MASIGSTSGFCRLTVKLPSPEICARTHQLSLLGSSLLSTKSKTSIYSGRCEQKEVKQLQRDDEVHDISKMRKRRTALTKSSTFHGNLLRIVRALLPWFNIQILSFFRCLNLSEQRGFEVLDQCFRVRK